MSNLKRLMAAKAKNKQQRTGPEFPKKILRDGDNKFRAVGPVHIQYEHWFKAADGTRVHSICTRNFDEETEGHEAKYCQVCKLYKEAWDIYNNPSDHSEEQVFEAGCMIGKEKEKNQEFPNSWKPKETAYINVIDRDDSDWHRENKKTKVLSKGESSPGISAGNGGILDEVIELVDEYGDYELYDIRLKKSGKKRDTEYRGYKGKEGDLTPEEKKYETFDFPNIFKPTDEKTIERWLTEGVKKKGEDAEGDDKKSDKKAESKTDKKPETKTDKKEETKKTNLKVKRTEPEPEPEEEQTTEAESGDEVEMAECPECNAVIPADSSACPKCGAEFEPAEGEEY
jgi:hypothetical protein